MFKLLFFAGLLSAAPAPQPDEYFRVPLPARRILVRADGDVNNVVYMRAIIKALRKFHYAKDPVPSFPSLDLQSRGLLQERQSQEGLTDQVEPVNIDELYYGPITTGSTARQIFTVDFDTGSSDLFIPGPKCNASAGCPHTTKYNQGGVDQGRTTTVTYGSGQVSGELYKDGVTVAGLTALNQALVSLTQAAGFASSNADGLLGMGFTAISSSGSTTYFENLIAQKKVSNPEFAFCLGRAADGSAQRSELTLGGIDSSKYTGSVTQVAVTKQGYWQVALDLVSVNGKSAGPTTPGQAAIDTGTTIILAPTLAAVAIHALIPGAFPFPLASGSTVTLFAYPCNTAAQYIPAIQFAGKLFAINPRDFNFGVLTASFATLIGSKTLASNLQANQAKYCLSAIAGADIDPTQNLYVVGDTFLKSWYSIYSYTSTGGKPSVGFAKSKC